MRVRASLSVFVLLFAACGESPFAPNTDVGLRVWADVSPSQLSVNDSLTVVRVNVKVQNGTGRVIRVVSGGPPYVFTNDPADSKGLWGSFRVSCDRSPLNCGPSIDWWGDSVYVFKAWTTYRDEATFTLKSWRAGGWEVMVGSYTVRAWFNGREGTAASFSLSP
jgi:hypothetical protein